MTPRNRIATAVLAGALLVSGAGHVKAQNKPDCPKGVADIEGQVVKVDANGARVNAGAAENISASLESMPRTHPAHWGPIQKQIDQAPHTVSQAPPTTTVVTLTGSR